jgi:hypothetical protein
MPLDISSAADIRPGDFYEDCFFHPCLCIGVEADGDEITGISLVDGSFPRGWSATHCGVRKLTKEEAIHWRIFGPQDREVEKKWWHDYPQEEWTFQYKLKNTDKVVQPTPLRGAADHRR